MLSDAIEEIYSSRGGTALKETESRTDISPKKREKKPMTKAEIEAYRQRKMREEEERYLGKPAKKQRKKRSAKPVKPVKPVRSVKQEGEKPKKMEKQDMASKIGAKRGRPRKAPEALQPMQPLHLMKIPGLPKGDYIAIYLVHGGPCMGRENLV